MLAEWQRTDVNYATRVTDLKNGTGLTQGNKLTFGTTVKDDGGSNIAERQCRGRGQRARLVLRQPGGRPRYDQPPADRRTGQLTRVAARRSDCSVFHRGAEESHHDSAGSTAVAAATGPAWRRGDRDPAYPYRPTRKLRLEVLENRLAPATVQFGLASESLLENGA